jgi:ferredoxin
MSLPVLNEVGEEKPQKISDKEIKRIEIDRDLCIGAESCVVVAPDAYEMDEENIAILKDGALQVDRDTLFESAQACPVAAIILYDDEDNQLYP